MAANKASREDVKVVLIDTQHVVTDPTSFKSVVQKLTGKDSCVAWIDESGFTGAISGRKPAAGDCVKSTSVDDNGWLDWRTSKSLSFKDLDKMTLEMQNMEEWTNLWGLVNSD